MESIDFPFTAFQFRIRRSQITQTDRKQIFVQSKICLQECDTRIIDSTSRYRRLPLGFGLSKWRMSEFIGKLKSSPNDKKADVAIKKADSIAQKV
jgi:hypothetical protein